MCPLLLFGFSQFIHTRGIGHRMLAEKLDMSYDEAERWIVNLVRNAKLDAKIDSKSGTVIMGPNHLNV